MENLCDPKMVEEFSEARAAKLSDESPNMITKRIQKQIEKVQQAQVKEAADTSNYARESDAKQTHWTGSDAQPERLVIPKASCIVPPSAEIDQSL